MAELLKLVVGAFCAFVYLLAESGLVDFGMLVGLWRKLRGRGEDGGEAE